MLSSSCVLRIKAYHKNTNTNFCFIGEKLLYIGQIVCNKLNCKLTVYSNLKNGFKEHVQWTGSCEAHESMFLTQMFERL